MKRFFTLFLMTLLFHEINAQGSQKEYFPKEQIKPKSLPGKHNLWIFLLAGQSNMAGRGFVQPQDTLPNARILSINQAHDIVVAKEPLHFYEPARTGLDCGLSFAQTLLAYLPDSVSILLVPAAVGGSPIQKWLNDSLYRNEIHLWSNAKEMLRIAQQAGTLKGILWHQGETNADTLSDIKVHADRLTQLIENFRTHTDLPELPFLLAELGAFSKKPDNFKLLNEQLKSVASKVSQAALIPTGDLGHKGDFLHFNDIAQREMGRRFAESYIKLQGSRLRR